MFTNHKTSFHVEQLDSRVLLSALNPFHRKFVDVTGEIMRQDLSTPPRQGPRAAQVYNFQGTGGVAELGRVETSGSVTQTNRGGSPSYRGNLTLTNDQGSVKIALHNTTYRIVSGTGSYKGATGLGAVSVGNTSGPGLVGLAFTADV